MTANTLRDDYAFTGGWQREGSALVFALLFMVESFVRSLNATVLSVQAYDILGSPQRVSVLSTIVSMLVLTGTLLSPTIFGRLRRRWVYSIGVCGAIAASICLGTHTVAGQAMGAFLRNFGAALMNITLSIYILDHISRLELTRSEPLRLTLSTLSWMSGPALGIALYNRIGPWGPQIVAMAAAVMLLALFWFLRLREPQQFRTGTIRKASPLNHIRRFTGQPRLRLAWLIAFARSSFWSTFFIYGPLLLIQGGQSKLFAGLVISASQGLLLLAYAYGRLAQRIGVRVLITACFASTALLSFAIVLTGIAHPVASAGLMLAGALFCTGLDAVGGIPFLRAVRPVERQPMAAVYRTFVELSELLPGIVYAIALSFFDVSIVFSLLGALLFVVAGVSWQYLPKSM